MSWHFLLNTSSMKHGNQILKSKFSDMVSVLFYASEIFSIH